MIVISATFVAEPLANPMTLLLTELGLDLPLQFAPYHQVFQQLLTPGSHFDQNRKGNNLVLLRLEDFVREERNSDTACQTVARTADELARALEAFAGRPHGPVVLALLEPTPGLEPALVRAIASANIALAARVSVLDGISLLDAQAIERVAGTERFDARRDALAHIPYTDAHFAALALALARHLHALRVPAAKVLVLDCDNTLWRGVIGEDGVHGITLSPAYLALQEFAIAQQRKGVLLCLASKNSEADVLAVLEQRDDMRLRPSDVVA
ncbi:MAG: hypothetical protein K9K38_18735, partial [Rhodoferax sp.]|nr:hypothetical protein [Rhodoferax sp.]